MPDDQGQIITPSTPGQSAGAPSADRPITVGYEPKPAEPTDDIPLMPTQAVAMPPEAPKPTAIPITIQDESGAPLSTPTPSPVSLPPEPTPTITPPAQDPAQLANVPPTFAPDMNKEALQSKIDSHPLFSGVKDKPLPKPSKAKRWLVWSAVLALIVIVAGYLAIDSGLVKGASHLPFHIFKQATPVAQPTINTQNTTQSSSQTADPYASWTQYCSPTGKMCLKHPTDWKLTTQTYTADQGPSPEVNTITSPSGGVTVSYIPSALGGGTGNSLIMYTIDVTSAQSQGLSVVSLIDKYNGSAAVPNPYSIEGFVTINLKTADGGTFAKGATLTSTYEPSIRRFNPANNTQLNTQLLIQDKKDSFSTQQEAQDEINTPEFQTALKILSSSSYEQ